MDQIIDRIGSQISTWLWFARSTRMGSDELVTDLLSGVGSFPRAEGADEVEAGPR